LRNQLIKTLTEIAEHDDRLVVLLADFAEYQFRGFKEKFPTRIINCGIREQAMVGMAAGLALEGMIPVCYTIAPFLLDRCWEFIKLDLIEQKQHAILVGFNGMDSFYGKSHKRKFPIWQYLDVQYFARWEPSRETLNEDLWNAYRNKFVNYVEIK
jgi:transketolase C-terminal domain/subunit